METAVVMQFAYQVLTVVGAITALCATTAIVVCTWAFVVHMRQSTREKKVMRQANAILREWRDENFENMQRDHDGVVQ